MITLEDREVLKLHGNNLHNILNGLITNDLKSITNTGIIYSCLLTPRGRFLCDFFIINNNDNSLYVDIAKVFTDTFVNKIKFYDIESEIIIELTNHNAMFSIVRQDGFLPDPRLQNFGYRGVVNCDVAIATKHFSYDHHRIKHLIPEGHKDLEQERSIILEFGFDKLNAISFTKGCYVGQELMARTKYLGEIRKVIKSGFTKPDTSANITMLSSATNDNGDEIFLWMERML